MMFQETPLLKLAKHCARFPGHQLKLVLASLVENNTARRLWDAPPTKGSFLLIHWDQGNNVFYIGGEPTSYEVAGELATLFNIKIKALAAAKQLNWFKVNLLPSWDEEMLPVIFPGMSLSKVERLFYSFPGDKPVPQASPDMPDIELTTIDRAFLERRELENLQLVEAEIEWMWSTEGKRRAREFGVAALKGNTIVCWCTAEYVSRQMCGIGIETLPEYMNRGIATATAARFVERCRERDIVPFWECDTENIGSVRVAEKVGFSLLEERTFRVGKFS